MSNVVTCQRSDLTREQALSIVTLGKTVWPEHSPQGVETLADALLVESSAKPDFQFHVIWRDGVAVAAAQSFARDVIAEEGGGRLFTVLALAGVCTLPGERGKGYGAAVVRAAFARVESGAYDQSLYQTGVPDFYRKLGARTVENRFVNRMADDPQVCPWWNDFIMVYPQHGSWPGGLIDLNGPGY